MAGEGERGMPAGASDQTQTRHILEKVHRYLSIARTMLATSPTVSSVCQSSSISASGKHGVLGEPVTKGIPFGTSKTAVFGSWERTTGANYTV